MQTIQQQIDQRQAKIERIKNQAFTSRSRDLMDAHREVINQLKQKQELLKIIQRVKKELQEGNYIGNHVAGMIAELDDVIEKATN